MNIDFSLFEMLCLLSKVMIMKIEEWMNKEIKASFIREEKRQKRDQSSAC